MRQLLAYGKVLGMRKPTPTYLLLEERLGRPLDRRVVKARGQGQSWNQIARALDHDTGIAVTSQTLRNWFPEVDGKRTAA